MDRLKFGTRVDRELNRLISEGEEEVAKPSCFLSQEQLDEHYNQHYKGYLKGLEAAHKKIKSSSLDNVSQNGDDYRSALFDLAFNYNGVVLHELYFSCLGS